MRGYDVAGVGGGGILAIGIAYVKVAPFFRRSRHTHTLVNNKGKFSKYIIQLLASNPEKPPYV